MNLPPDAAQRRSDAIASARRWLGTPYVLGAARLGAGADCLGLVEGVAYDVSDRVLRPRGPWRADWHSHVCLLTEGSRHGFVPLPVAQAAPGDVVAIRYTRKTPEHLAIMATERSIIHSVEGRGVVEVHLGQLRPRIAAAALFPGPVA